MYTPVNETNVPGFDGVKVKILEDVGTQEVIFINIIIIVIIIIIKTPVRLCFVFMFHQQIYIIR